MSQLTYIASNAPLPEIKNPHYKTLSVNEALSMGIKVPEFLLEPDHNRDKPDVILWSDTELALDTDTGTMANANFDDDFAILRLSEAANDIYTEKKYRCYIEWTVCTAGRSQEVLDYIRAQLACIDEIELWNIWMGHEGKPRIKKHTTPMDQLTPNDIMELEGTDIFSEPPTQYCLVITNDGLG